MQRVNKSLGEIDKMQGFLDTGSFIWGLYKMPEKQGAGGVFEYHILAHLHDSSQTALLQETWAVPRTAAEQH